LPIYYTHISKLEYSGEANAEALKNKLVEIVGESKLFNALVDWESRIAAAARQTTNSLFRLTKPSRLGEGENYQDCHTGKLQNVLAVIGNETIGVKNALNEPEVAIDSGLAPVLYDHLQAFSEEQDRTIWLDAVPGIGKRIDFQQDLKAHLNSFYHVQEVRAETSLDTRGAWIEINADYTSVSENKAKLERSLGKKLTTILDEEFLNCKKGSKIERSAARNATKLGFIELSAECDQAQKKTKLHKFLLSALIPIEHIKFTFFGDDDRNTAHVGIYRSPNVIINGQEYVVKVSFMYQIGVKPEIHKWLGKPIFILKEQILADISYKSSQHASRPGIIRFD
jgi:hypothetical protein